MTFPAASSLISVRGCSAGYPTQRAILMDVIPQKDRGFWSSLENLTSFTWTGSAGEPRRCFQDLPF